MDGLLSVQIPEVEKSAGESWVAGDDPGYDAQAPLISSIDYALETIGYLGRHIAVLEAAKSASPAQQKLIARLSRQALESTARQFSYSVESIPAVESIVALESDVNDAKSFLSKMIDSIIEAFKKLWEMLFGQITKSISGDSAGKSADELIKDLEEAVKNNGTLPENATLKSAKHKSLIAYLGKSIAMSDLEKVATTHIEYIAQLVQAVEMVSKRISETKALASKFKADTNPDDIAKALLDFDGSIIGDLKNALKSPYDREALDRFGLFGEEGPGDSQIAVLGPVMGKAGPAVLFVSYAGEGKFKSGYKTKQVEDKQEAEIKLPGNLAELHNFASKVAELQKAVGKMNDEMRGKLNGFKSDANGLNEALKNLKELNDRANTTKATDSIKKFGALAKNVGSIEAALIAAMNGLQNAAGAMGSIIQDAITLSEKKEKGKKDEKVKGEFKDEV